MTLQEVVARFEHMDKLLSDPMLASSDNPFAVVARDLWLAIKEHLAAEAAQHCDTCALWYGRTESFGFCEWINGAANKDWGAWLSCGRTCLTTMPDFGCVAWKQRQ